MILPLRVRGSSSTKSSSLGATAGPSRRRARPRMSRRSSWLGSAPAGQHHERLDAGAGDGIGLADHAGLGDVRVRHQRGLDLERADQVPGRLDHVVAAADEPEVAVGVATRQVSRAVPAAYEALAVALGLVQVAAEHRRPARSQGQLALDLRLGELDRLPVLEDQLALVVAGQDARLHPRQRLAHRSRAGSPSPRSSRS